METNEVGKIICILRKRLNITQQALCRGLCSVSKISRIESGERMPDMLLMEALFQRLGKSPDKIEMMLSERDYTLCGIRMEIELALLRRDYLEAESQLNLYAKQKEAKHTLHSQYLYKMKGVLQREAYHDSKKSMEYLKKAVLLTLPNFESEKIEKCLLSVREIQLLLLLAQNEMEEQEDEAIALMAELKIYLDKNYTDEEEKVKIYPKVAYLLAKALVKKKHYEEASKLCEKAMDLLGNGGVTICLLEIVQLQIECFRDRGNKKRLSLLIQEKESLESLYKKYDMEIPKNEINIWEENTQREIYLIHELLKKSRIKKKMTQENLTNEIDIEQETISRIETGKRPPSRQTFQRMKDELGIDRTYYMGYISADEFEIHEKKREISKLIFLRKYKEAQDYLRDIENNLIMNTDENVQYILYTDTVLKFRLGEISYQSTLEKYKQALSMTQKEYFDNEIFSGLLTRQEVFILNNISIVFRRINLYDEAIDILEKVLSAYEKSEVDIKFHSVGIILTLVNLSSYYEERGSFNKAIEICDKGIKLCLEYGRGNCIVEFLTEKAHTMEQIDKKNKKACIKKFKQAFFVSKLMKNAGACDAIEIHLINFYKKNLLKIFR